MRMLSRSLSECQSLTLNFKEVTAIINTHTLLDEEGDVGHAGQVEQIEGLQALRPPPPPLPLASRQQFQMKYFL